jgi:adenine-specific DNA-methyltransferase
MIPAFPFSIKQSLNKAYRLIKPKRASMEAFKTYLVRLLGQIDEKESEENAKIHLMDFLKNTFYHPDFLVATKGKTDLVVHTGKDAKTPAGVLFEVKRPTNKADMVSRQNLNAKALHELILYYLRERFDHNNTDVRQLVITNIYEWFIFDAQDFERLFGKSTQLKKDY